MKRALASADQSTAAAAVNSAARYLSPWTIRKRIGMLAWQVVWGVFARPTPKPLYRWRLLLLRLFGCKVEGRPFIAATARVQIPWNLELRDRACVGDRVVIYNLGKICLGRACTIAQESYLCAGTHAFDDPAMPLIVAPIEVGEEAFVGARAFIMPGVRIGAGALVGACAVVTRDVDAWTVVAGNPARPIGQRRSWPLEGTAVVTGVDR